ncbi:T9SS type A sorting domain-containing protein [Tenacibaculum sp. 190524A02b]|uniref:T9SS type A sorting domain-containing protein n=1 Tax=Tenacibaculum vairaonense TaxID=3137860 RepID=UPI0031FABB46
MKKTIFTLLLLCFAATLQAQLQENAPWANDTDKLYKKSKPTLKSIAKSAENYFNTIDRNKKGSGLKPFKRWEYHWSKYTNKEGIIAPPQDLWKAWAEKNQLSEQNRKNNGDWRALGPFENSNRYNARNFKQSGQGRVNAIAVDPNNSNTYYVGSPAGGIWKSTDAGLNWQPLTDYLPQIGVSGIAIHPTNSNIIYIATGDDDANDSYSVGVWKSTDGGTTWNNTGAISGNPRSMNEIYINPDNPETILVATSKGVQKTTNGGNTWNRVLNANVLDLKMKPGNPNVWYAVTKDKFYKSTDGGNSFTQKTITGLSNSSRLTMDVTKANANYIYIVSASNSRSSFNGIYKSTDSGESFSRTQETNDIFKSTQAWYDLALTVSSADPDIVYVGVLNIWKSTNGGNSFTQLNEWYNPNSSSYTHADIHFLRFLDGKFFAGTDGGIYVSTDEGKNFIDLTKRLAISQFYKISVSQQAINATIAGGLQDNGGFGFSGDKWYNYHGGDGMEGLVSPKNPNIFYGFTQYGGSLNISNDGGKSQANWVGAPAAEVDRDNNDSGGRWVTPLSANSKGELYAGYSQLYKLESNAWKKVSNHSFGGDLNLVEIDPNDDNYIYVVRNQSLYRSSDKGTTFTKVPFANEYINSIEISNNDSNTAWVVTNWTVYKTSNIRSNNPNFTDITRNLPSESKTVIKHYAKSTDNTVYLGTNLGVYYTNDDLNEWKTFDNGLPNTQVRDLEINEEAATLYAATYGRGVFYTDIPTQQHALDIKVVSINNINSDIIYSPNSLKPEVTVKNLGTEEITSFKLEYNYNDIKNTYNWTGNLSSGNEISFNIPKVDNLPFGNNTLTINAILTNETYTSNNKTAKTFLVNTFNNNPSQVITFENESEKLLTENDMWEVGYVNKTLLKTPSGNRAYVTKRVGNYPNKAKGYLYTHYYNLSTISNPTLKFKMAFDIENNYDYLIVEYSTNQGLNWTTLGDANSNNWYTSSTTVNNLPGKQWTGEGARNNPNGGKNSDVHTYMHDLSSVANETNILFRFAFITDDLEAKEGVVIDDLVIEGVLSTNDDVISIDKNISIFPNPSESIFNIKWEAGKTINLKVLDITGKEIISKKGITGETHQLNLQNYAKGIYLLNLEQDGALITKKLLLK